LAAKVTACPDLEPIDLEYAFLDYDINRVDILHFFNGISFGRTPWISTFETVLPRYQKTLTCHHGRMPDFAPLKDDVKVRRAIEAMSGDACRNIIAISNCNRQMQLELLGLFPDFREAIERKIVVLHPPQLTFFDEYDAKRIPDDGPIKFIFVGGSFFRKGGMEMLRAFEALRAEGLDVMLTIVSALLIDDYATKETAADVERAKSVIAANSDWISYYPATRNDEVLALMKASHVGLLPTHADTYGYSVLEMQGCGCPVMTTDVRALPEINNDECGWIVKVPKNRLGEAIYTTVADRQELSRVTEAGIVDIVRGIVRDRAVIRQKAEAALRRIRLAHAPDRHAERLRGLYFQSLRGQRVDRKSAYRVTA